jgi:molybdopterin-guanine dinucleotide biosynthesis protein A
MLQGSLPNRDIAGLVLAGGRSVRFGGEKAAALLDGKPLMLWAAERLAASCVHVAINARPGAEVERLAGPLPVLHDHPGDPDGPLAGVRVGLAWAAKMGARALAVSPCDAPLLPDDLYPRLIAAAGDGGALAVTPDGRQPLCAVWPVTALHWIEDATHGGAHPPTWKVLEEIGAIPVQFENSAAFANINTQDDLARIDRLAAMKR